MPNARVLALAATQDGLITRAQALANGMTRAALEHAIRPLGPWRRVVPGVYGTFTGPLTELHRLRAAVLYAGGTCLVTGPRACALHGLRYGPLASTGVGDATADGAIDVLVESTRHRSSSGFIRVRRTVRLPTPVWWVDEDIAGGWFNRRLINDEVRVNPHGGVIPLVPVARAVADTVIRVEVLPPGWRPQCAEPAGCPSCWRGESHEVRAMRNMRALMCEAVQRSKASISQLAAEIEAAPRRGSALPRRVIGDLEAGCRSAPECELRDLVLTSRVVPEPRWNAPLPGARGIVPDGQVKEVRLALEVDSRAFHGFGDAPERTERKRARYAALGWRVLPISPTRLRREPHAVLREIEAAYLAGLR